MTTENLRLSLIQPDLLWQDLEGNRERLAEYLQQLAGGTDLILLPEMFTAGFGSRENRFAEDADGPTLDWMRTMAAETGAAITGSYAVTTEGLPVNRLQWVTPQGEVSSYDKRHLFRMAGEHKRYGAGSDKLLVSLKGWRICPMVCYDLRFPVWCRNNDDYDLLLFVANWPAARSYQWSQLLIARAIENLSYVAGVNRVGTDGNGLHYDGCSAVVDPEGREILQTKANTGAHSVTLDWLKLQEFRQSFPAHLDADQFELKS